MSNNNVGRPKGTPKTGGRKKGTPNKLGANVKEMLLEALDRKGGVKYFVEQAEENPTAFMALVGKILPMQVVGDAENPLHMVSSVEVKFVKAEHTDP